MPSDYYGIPSDIAEPQAAWTVPHTALAGPHTPLVGLIVGHKTPHKSEDHSNSLAGCQITPVELSTAQQTLGPLRLALRFLW